MGTGLIGKILSKNQHTYSTSSKPIAPKDPKDDHNYDHKPGPGDIAISEGANTGMKLARQKMNRSLQPKPPKPPLNHQIAHKHSDGSKHGYVNPPGKMNSPLNSYANPRFVDTESGQKEEIAASKIMLDGAIKKFNEPSRKAVRQAKRSERKVKRADAREVRQADKFKDGTNRSDNGYGLLGQLPKSVKKSRYEKKTAKLRTDAVKLSNKSDANKMIAEEKAKYEGMTQNQIYLQKERESKNNNNNNNSTTNMFSISRENKLLARTEKQKKLDKLFGRNL
jgi:hypothetical protein